ncbi:MAG TPA: ABC transporter ATP-binding protein [Candidatus Paceibacterota bacterium]|nr:ABC transporter ATP-binding protein [Candidatus Paceibacterota bacterium]
MQSEPRKKDKKSQAVLRDYARAALKYPWLLATVFIGGAVIEASSVGASLALRDVIDLLTESVPGEAAVGALFAALGIFAAVSFLGWVGQRIRQAGLVYLEPKVMTDLTSGAFAYLIRHSSEFFANSFAGTLTRRVTRYARSFESVLDNVSFNFYSTALYVAGILAVLFSRSMVLGGIVLAWTIVFILVQVGMARWRQPLRVARADEDSKVTGVISDAVSNHSAITLFAAETAEQGTLGMAVEKWRKATLRSWVADMWIWGVQGLFVLAVEIGLLGIAIYLWGQGAFTVGDVVLVQLYVIGLIDRVWNIGNAMRHLYDSFADAYEMIEIMETAHAVQDATDATALGASAGEIALQNVGFKFKEERTILSGFDLTIQGGERVALVGPSGAGKSTITKLLLRLYDVTEGAIRIDGQDIRSVTQESLRKAISFVPQEPVLFHRTLRENIAYGKPDASLEEIIEAAKKAHCHEFIRSLPEGYETYVGERGVKLSGGERQRVAIARAILKDAPILVLDEATSSLDSESEALIQDALRTLMEGKTVLVIAHRLSTIMTMDRIIVIENGAIAAEGTHAELVNHEGGLYRKLWSIQAGSFVTDDKTPN